MEPPKSSLLNALSQDFARATGGCTRVRTATFINSNLQDLGVREWMEAYSLNGADWTLKRMVLQPHEGSSAIHQHTQQHAHKNFLQALLSLQDYEAAQLALGYLMDGDDFGQITSAPLFRDIARAEGIPHDVNGQLVVPQQGHIIADGVYPVDAFALAAAGHARKDVLATKNSEFSDAIRLHDSSGSFILTPPMRKALDRYTDYLSQGLKRVRAQNLDGLLDNKHGLSFLKMYRSGYDEFLCHDFTQYSGDFPAQVMAKAGGDLQQIPQKLSQYLQYHFVSTDVLLRGIILSSMLKQEAALNDRGGISKPARATLNQAIIDWRQAGREFKPLLTKAYLNDLHDLRDMNVDDMFKVVELKIRHVYDVAKSASIEVNDLPVFLPPDPKETAKLQWEDDLARQAIEQRSLPFNGGPR